MTELQRTLYETFQSKLDAWSKKRGPHSKNWNAESIVTNPEYFLKFSSFRVKEWTEYVKARDEYLFYIKHGSVH